MIAMIVCWCVTLLYIRPKNIKFSRTFVFLNTSQNGNLNLKPSRWPRFDFNP